MSNVPLTPWAQVGSATLYQTGAALPDELSREDWRALWPKFRDMHSACSWALADWMIYGLDHFGEQYAYGVTETGKNVMSLRTLVWVGRTFPAYRRRYTLPFSIHQEIASLPEAEQDRLLEEAEHKDWSTSDVRCEVRQLKGNPAVKDEPGGPAVRGFIPSSWVNEGLRYFTKEDVRGWEDTRKAALRRDLQPIVDIYQQL